jgi:hypothetical protein
VLARRNSSERDPLAPLGTRYLARALRAAASSPADAGDRLIEKIAFRWEAARLRGERPAPRAAEDWERRLHELLGAPWPCPQAHAFATTWDGVVETMRSQGLRVGRRNYGEDDDADPGLARTLWCLVRHLDADTVIETGVAHGVSSRVMLEAMTKRPGAGLYSIDLPPMVVPDRRTELGAAVPASLRAGWTLLEGSSRRHLPSLLRRIDRVDLFVHDSLHSTRNVHWELATVWPALRPGGVVVVDVEFNWGFERFLQAGEDRQPLWCSADDGQRLFAVARKQAPADHEHA